MTQFINFDIFTEGVSFLLSENEKTFCLLHILLTFRYFEGGQSPCFSNEGLYSKITELYTLRYRLYKSLIVNATDTLKVSVAWRCTIKYIISKNNSLTDEESLFIENTSFFKTLKVQN
ncbi:MAG: hypothetical protein JNL70_19950 [Saprospiraceae bacterium]|nr:hypothetical protein [Saprospiraceae bacterium]